MYNYEKNELFLKSIEEKEIFSVKSLLVDMIQRTKGKRKELDEAISYAIAKEAFQWEEDDKDDMSMKFTNKTDEYDFEMGRLSQNFSKERYNKIIELCKEIYPKKNIYADNKKTINNTFSKNESTKKINKEAKTQSRVVKRKAGLFDTDDPKGLINARIAVIALAVIIVFILVKII